MKRFIRIVCIIVSIIILGFIIISVLSQLKQKSIVKTYQETLEEGITYVNVQGIEIAYREFGNVDDPVLLFIHGFLGSSDDFRDVFLELDDYHIIALDLPGFGFSEKSVEYNYSKENQAQTVIAFIELLTLSDVTLIGHSMGGEIALRVANQRSDLIHKLVLVASAGLHPSSSRASLPRFFYDHILNNYYFQRWGFKSVYYDKAYATALNFDPMYFFTHQIPASVLQKFSQDVDTLSVDEFIDSIQIPTLLLWGDKDTWVPLTQGETMLERLDNATLVVLPNVGHLPFDEALTDFNQALLTFLAR